MVYQQVVHSMQLKCHNYRASSRSRKNKANFAGFSETNLRKNPANFTGIFWANFPEK